MEVLRRQPLTYYHIQHLRPCEIFVSAGEDLHTCSFGTQTVWIKQTPTVVTSAATTIPRSLSFYVDEEGFIKATHSLKKDGLSCLLREAISELRRNDKMIAGLMEFSRVESSIHQMKDEIKSIKELTESSSTQQQPSAQSMDTVLKEKLGTICEKIDLLKPVENSTHPSNNQPVNGNNDVQLLKQLRCYC